MSQNPDAVLAAVEAAVISGLVVLDDTAEVMATHGDRDAIHVTAVSRAFSSMDAKTRNSIVWPKLRELDPELLLRISVVLLLAPSEYKDLRMRRDLALT